MRTIVFLFALACRLQHTALFLAQVQSTYLTLPKVCFITRPAYPLCMYILPHTHFAYLPTLPTYLVVCLSWWLRPKSGFASPSVSVRQHMFRISWKKKGRQWVSSVRTVLVAFVSYSPILHVGLQEEEEEEEEEPVRSGVCVGNYLHEDLGRYCSHARKRATRFASPRPARARVSGWLTRTRTRWVWTQSNEDELLELLQPHWQGGLSSEWGVWEKNLCLTTKIPTSYIIHGPPQWQLYVLVLRRRIPRYARTKTMVSDSSSLLY